MNEFNGNSFQFDNDIRYLNHMQLNLHLYIDFLLYFTAFIFFAVSLTALKRLDDILFISDN